MTFPSRLDLNELVDSVHPVSTTDSHSIQNFQNIWRKTMSENRELLVNWTLHKRYNLHNSIDMIVESQRK